MNLSTRQKQSYKCRRETYGFGGGDKLEEWIHIHTLLTSKGLLQSAGNSIQYPVVVCVGKEPKKEWTCGYP